MDYSFSSHTFFDCACHTYASEKRANGLRQVDFRLRSSSLSVPISATINSFVVIATSQSLIVSLAWMLLGGLTARASPAPNEARRQVEARVGWLLALNAMLNARRRALLFQYQRQVDF